MLSTGIPELKSADDISYLREAFLLDDTNEVAAEKFLKLIHQSLNTTRTQVNNAVHIFVHKKGD